MEIQILLLFLATSLASAYNATYEWQSTPWSACTSHDPRECCQCSRKRTTHCVLKTYNPGSIPRLIPPFYCRKLPEPEPHETELCSQCDHDCVHNTWSDWSKCSESCLPATRYRTRQVLLLPTGEGRECDSLIEVTSCKNLPQCDFVDPRPRYNWSVTPWTSCRMVESESDELCGQGHRLRDVYCVDRHDSKLADDFCLQYMLGQPRPHNKERCELPCPCAVSQWTPWSECTQTCSTHTEGYQNSYQEPSYQRRTRSVVSDADSGAMQCPYLSERRVCEDVPKCERYIWYSALWTECIMSGPISDLCGSGQQIRDVYCILEGDVTETSVDSRLCSQEASVSPHAHLRPPGIRACEVACPLDCQLGEWESWSVCSQSCGDGGRRIRRRPILEEGTPGGLECDADERYERGQCESTPCSWWNVGQWSACFLHDYEASCGPGSQIRNVYCISSMAQVLLDQNCTFDKPSYERDCRVPCEEECTLSEWSSWSKCTEHCGFNGGNQTRNRTILAGTDGCVPVHQLYETRECNKKSCDLYIWQVTPWSQCVLSSNSTVSCGLEGSGVQYRQAHCHTDEGVIVPDNNCLTRRPTAQQSCAAPCPQNCILGSWGSWTSCGGAICGENHKFRARRVDKIALYGGSGCELANQDGIIVDTRVCKSGSPCESYTWNMTDWGACQTTDQCGQGVQERFIYCKNSQGKLVENDHCLNKVMGSTPTNQKRCYKPCEADCTLSQWSEFSECSVTCGINSGAKTRYRTLEHPDILMTLEEQCPHLTEADLVHSHTCEDQPCPQYSWQVGDWTSCITDSPSDCGPGIQKRHVYCQSSDGQHTSSEKCSGLLAEPEGFRQCDVYCQADCSVSDWGDWGPCSHSCGYGLSSRTRSIQRRPINGGRRCPSLEENRTCKQYDCSQFLWRISQWGECTPHYNMPCGDGQRTREVRCPAGKAMEGECRRRAQKPVILQQCRVPCQGDCDLSEWSSWSVCDCSQQNASRSRIRAITVEPRPNGKPCGPSKEVEPCQCPGYKLVIGNWTTCRPETLECGSGTKDRWVQCVRQTDEETVPLSFCIDRHINVQVKEECQVPCPRDCQLTEFSDWSGCRKSCGIDAVKQRTRDVRRKNNKYGKHCPASQALVQKTTCDSLPCFTYQWRESPWSPCTVDVTTTCGLGMMMRQTQCYRSDGFIVDGHFCGKAVPTPLEEVPCGLPCPGDCVMSQWSTFSDCFNYCKDTRKGSQVRSRTILIPAEGGQSCPEDWVEKKSCSNPMCPHFYWKTKAWDQHGRRKVFCSPSGGDYKVFGGCVEQDKPPRKLDCSPRCGLYANCLEGACVCQAGFKGDGYTCLPEYGCHANLHCIVNNSFCDPSNKECLCLDGTLPTPDMYCAAPLGQSTKGGGISVIVIYILIGCLCGVILLAVIIAACFISKKKPASEEKRPPAEAIQPTPRLAKIDNLDMERNNTLHKLHDDGNTFRSQKSDFSDASDLNVIKGGREGIAPAVSMPIYYGKSQIPNLNEANISPFQEDQTDAHYHGKSLGHLELPSHHLLSAYQAAPYIANVQPQPRSASANPYISYPPRTPTPETNMTTFKPEDTPVESPWHVISKPNNSSPRSDKPRRFDSPGGVGSFYLSPPSGVGSSGRLSPGGDTSGTALLTQSPSGHALYRVPEHSVAQYPVQQHYPRGRSGSLAGQYNPDVNSPNLGVGGGLYHPDYMFKYEPDITPNTPPHHQHQHQRGHSDPTKLFNKSKYPSENTEPPLAQHDNNPTTTNRSTQAADSSLPSEPVLNNPAYNSLPRHYSQQRPAQTYGLDPRESHSDVEQMSPSPNGPNVPQPYKYNQKYGSLPSKGRVKKDAAQNLLEYCDALLADLEKAAKS